MSFKGKYELGAHPDYQMTFDFRSFEIIESIPGYLKVYMSVINEALLNELARPAQETWHFSCSVSVSIAVKDYLLESNPVCSTASNTRSRLEQLLAFLSEQTPLKNGSKQNSWQSCLPWNYNYFP